MTSIGASVSTYRACPAHAFRAEFGVCRGEAISRFEDLNLGDIYQVKSQIDWWAVSPLDDATTEFSLGRAANLPAQHLVTLADLIFLTTTGRRTDVLAAFCEGHLYLICEDELKTGFEYVLIDIQTRDADFTPTLIPAPVAPMLSYVREPAEIVPFRRLG